MSSFQTLHKSKPQFKERLNPTFVNNQPPSSEDKLTKSLSDFKQSAMIKISLNPKRKAFQESVKLRHFQKMFHQSLTVALLL